MQGLINYFPWDIKLTEDQYSKLKAINKAVNHDITYMTDQEQYGKEYWDIGVKYGDCDNYMLGKRDEAIKEGFPWQNLRLCILREYEMDPIDDSLTLKWRHAILIVRTVIGDLGMTNNDDAVRPINSWDIGNTWQLESITDERGDFRKVI